MCRKVLIVSTDPAHSKEFKRSAGADLITAHIPLPSRDEVLSIAEVHDISPEEAMRRFDIVGAIPRYVCAKDFRDMIVEVERALERFTFKLSIYNSEVVAQGGERLSNRIFHENATANFEKRSFTLGSPYISDLYMKMWKMHQIDTFKQFIASRNSMGVPTEYSKAFERFAHDILSGGNKRSFHTRMLHQRNFIVPQRLQAVKSTIFPCRKVIHVGNNPDFETITEEGVRGAYLQPVHGNFGAVDSVVLLSEEDQVSVDLFQMTINPHHGMNGLALDSLLLKIRAFLQTFNDQRRKRKRKEFIARLFFVVPDYIFPNFKLQGYSDGLSAEMKNSIEQYALEIETDK
eukprot:gene29534-35648_t